MVRFDRRSEDRASQFPTDEDATNLMGAKFVHCSADILSALFNNAAKHEAQPELLGSLLAVHHNLGGTVEAVCGKAAWVKKLKSHQDLRTFAHFFLANGRVKELIVVNDHGIRPLSER